MKMKDIIKKQTTIIAVAVVLVIVAAIGVSYAVFFDVKASKDNQVITAGTLKLTVTGVSALGITQPTNNESGLASSPVSYTVKNTDSNLPATYSIYIYAADDNTMDLSKIKISYDGNATKGNTAVVLNSITDKFTEDGITYYKIKSGDLAAKTSGSTQYLRVWLDEDAINGDISNKKLSLNLYIISEVKE